MNRRPPAAARAGSKRWEGSALRPLPLKRGRLLLFGFLFSVDGSPASGGGVRKRVFAVAVKSGGRRPRCGNRSKPDYSSRGRSHYDIYCETCQVIRKSRVDVMPPNEKNDHGSVDLICKVCDSIIVTLHAEAIDEHPTAQRGRRSARVMPKIRNDKCGHKSRTSTW
jgi:hypothetical protein